MSMLIELNVEYQLCTIKSQSPAKPLSMCFCIQEVEREKKKKEKKIM